MVGSSSVILVHHGWRSHDAYQQVQLVVPGVDTFPPGEKKAVGQMAHVVLPAQRQPGTHTAHAVMDVWLRPGILVVPLGQRVQLTVGTALPALQVLLGQGAQLRPPYPAAHTRAAL